MNDLILKNNLKEARAEKGLSQEELAKMEYNAKARINNLKKDEQNIQKQMKDNWKSFIPRRTLP